MEFRTVVDIENPGFEIAPCEEILLVGSCFADHIGRRFAEEKFRVTVNPYGTMYNPVSILHTLQRCETVPRVVFLTLGTNHVYRLRETGEIVDNCAKRPQSLFQEEELPVDECYNFLLHAVSLLRGRRPDVHVVLTVSPIRYRKYGYHGSQLSKATLLLAASQLVGEDTTGHVHYFPAYEIFMDELRDYRFYAPDMLHPSEQAVDYVWERLSDSYLGAEARQFVKEWQPLKRALAHRPFRPDSEEYQALMEQTHQKIEELKNKYTTFVL